MEPSEQLSAENIRRDLKLTATQAWQVAGLIEGTIDPETFASVQQWRAQCYHWPPRRAEMVLRAINETLGGYGDEAITADGYWVDRYHHNVIAAYVNLGDAYACTVVHDTEHDTFHITSWGDWLTEWEGEHPVCAYCGVVLDDEKRCPQGHEQEE